MGTTIANLPRYDGDSSVIEVAERGRKATCMHCGEYKPVWLSYAGIWAPDYVEPECFECVGTHTILKDISNEQNSCRNTY